MSEAADEKDDSVGVRWPELAVALLLMALAGLVITDSIRVGTGWGDDGPRSGYFPFYIGLALLLSAGWVAAKQLLRWRVHEPFAERGQLTSVWAILWPMAIYVGLIFPLGIYVASALLIAYFMLRHGKHGVALTAAVALGVPLTFFLVFERWFLVALPKGPLEALFGF
ncbi:MAG: tripartite tricarboxylate transporter TctB family protein [Rubrivivax sp.]|nr:tripartite tricarboxylate transporter TctB family protein [Rubrivivax sp.]